jgi:hypothetical protein
VNLSPDDVTAWLAKTGYPLEMSVAREFRKISNFAEQSRYYRDVNTGEYREIDVVSAISSVDSDGWLEFFFVVECKSNGVPWVIFVDIDAVSGVTNVEHWVDLIPCYSQDDDHIGRLIARTEGRNMPLLAVARQPGYGIVAKRDEGKSGVKNRGDENPYDAVRQAAAASLSLVSERSKPLLDEPTCSFAIPVVVTKSPLFEVWLGHDGKVCAQEVKRTSTLVHMGDNGGYVLVYIWSHEMVKNLAEECVTSAQAFRPLG